MNDNAPQWPLPFGTRRGFLTRAWNGLGALALAGLVADETHADTPLTPRPAHLPRRAKRCIFLMMEGGPSHIDTFEHKPLLQRDHGKPLPFDKPKVTFAKTGNLLNSPFALKQHQQEAHSGNPDFIGIV